MNCWLPEKSERFPIASKMRSSVGPKRQNEMRNSAERVRGQVRLNREHQERDKQADGDPGMHVSRKGEAAHQGESAEAINHVVHVETVARTQALADPCQGTVERVAQPVEREAGDHGEKRVAIACGEGVKQSRANLRGEAEDGQVVWTDAVWSARGQPEQGMLFGGGDPTFLHTKHVGKGTGAAHLQKDARVYLFAEFGHGLGIESCHTCLRFSFRAAHASNFARNGAGDNAPEIKLASNEDQEASD